MALSVSLNAAATIETFVVPLDGHQEINPLTGLPDGGDLDGVGTATLMIDDVANTISWDITVSNILLPPLGDPTGFYVNIHNEQFTSGAIRGQLGAPVPAPSALLLMGTAVAAGMMRLRRRRLN